MLEALGFIGFLVYISVSCTLIPLPVPHLFISFGAMYPPALVAVIGSTFNLIGATVDYKFGENIIPHGSFYRKKVEPHLSKLHKHGFWGVVLAAFVPVVLEPITVASGYVKYDIRKYYIAVFIGRTMRFYIYAKFGEGLLSIITTHFGA